LASSSKKLPKWRTDILSIATVMTLLGPAVAAPTSPTAPLDDPSPRYQIVENPGDLEERFTEEEIRLLERLNRADGERMLRLDHLVVPDVFSHDPLVYSPFPDQVDGLAGKSKTLLVHQPLQVWAAYEEGRLVRWGPVSTGREAHPTPSGRFFLTWRSTGRESTVNSDWFLEWYYNFHNDRGLSFHQYELPGYPASRACARLLERDARWIFDWGESWTLDDQEREVLEEGTPVWILGEYDFHAPAPWWDEVAPHPAIPVSEIEDWLSAEDESASGEG